MTTADAVPKWFADFTVVNEQAHSDLAQAIAGVRGDQATEIASLRGDLGVEIAGVKGELRIIKAMTIAGVGAIFVGLAASFVALLKYLIGF